MDIERLKIIVELLQSQISIWEDLDNPQKLNASIERARHAMARISNAYDGNINYEMDYGDTISRLDIELSVKGVVSLGETIPDYLPDDIFHQLHGKPVPDMIQLLRDYKMPEHDIKPFLRRILPADDV